MYKEITLEEVKAQLESTGKAIGLVNPSEYHEWKNELPNVVSQTDLKAFAASPYAYKWDKEHGVRTETPAMLFGSAVDCLTLTPHLWDSTFTSEAVDKRTKAGKERAAELEAKGIKVIKPEDFEVVKLASDNLLEVIKSEFGEYQTQIGMWLKVESIGAVKLATPLILTGMIDLLPMNQESGIVDAKTTSVNLADDNKLCWHFRDLGYILQATYYRTLFNSITGEEREDFHFLAVESKPPCRTRLVSVDAFGMIEQQSRIFSLLDDYATALATGEWGTSRLPNLSIAD